MSISCQGCHAHNHPYPVPKKTFTRPGRKSNLELPALGQGGYQQEIAEIVVHISLHYLYIFFYVFKSLLLLRYTICYAVSLNVTGSF